MSDLPDTVDDGGEELDLGEIEEGEADDAAEGGEDGSDGADEEHADDGEEEGQEGDVEPPPPPRQGRKSQAQRWRERAERAEREAAEARGFRQAAEHFQQRQPQVDPMAAARAQQERAERLAMMSPVEAAEFIANERAQQFQQALLYQQLQTRDELDRRDFNQQARTSRLHQQYKERVESELVRKRQAGDLMASREEILHRLVGEAAMERATRAAPAQRRAASRRVAGQTTRPTNARGDGSAGRGRPAPGSEEHDDMLVDEYFRRGGRL